MPGSLPNTRKAFKGYKPLSITQRQPQDETMSAVSLGSLLATSSPSSSLSATSAQLTELPSQLATSKLHVFELLNEDVKLPAMETLYWCKVFEFQEFSQKQHLVKVSYFLFKFLARLTIFSRDLHHRSPSSPDRFESTMRPISIQTDATRRSFDFVSQLES